MLDLSSPHLTKQLRIASLETRLEDIQDAVRELKECYRLVSRLLEIERSQGPELPDDLEATDFSTKKTIKFKTGEGDDNET